MKMVLIKSYLAFVCFPSVKVLSELITNNTPYTHKKHQQDDVVNDLRFLLFIFCDYILNGYCL